MLVWLLPCITASLLTLVPLLTTCQRLIISSQHSGPLGLSACRLICSYQVLVVNMEVQVTCSLNLGLSDLPGKMFKHVVSRSSRAAWTRWVHPTRIKADLMFGGGRAASGWQTITALQKVRNDGHKNLFLFPLWLIFILFSIQPACQLSYREYRLKVEAKIKHLKNLFLIWLCVSKSSEWNWTFPTFRVKRVKYEAPLMRQYLIPNNPCEISRRSACQENRLEIPLKEV